MRCCLVAKKKSWAPETMIIDKIAIFRYITIILDAVIAIYTQLTNNKVIFIEIIRLTICKPEGSDGKEVESFEFSFS